MALNNSLISFKDDPELGAVVSSIKPFCKLWKDMEVPTYDYIVGVFGNPLLHGLAGHKWSRLCGFTFTSNVNTKTPKFQFVYVPKLRGNFTRNNAALHGWYCWRSYGIDNKEVTAVSTMSTLYNFNINKFVHSDLFDKYIPFFVQNIHFALDNQVKTLYDSITESGMKKELAFYVKAIRTSLGTINKVKEIVSDEEYARRHKNNPNDDPNFYAYMSDPKAGHARVAYNADKNYGLVNLDKNQSVEQTSTEQSASVDNK